jgi:glycogen debranching enzyme
MIASRRFLAETTSPAQFGREICGSLCDASERKWLVTNGIGGFASGTVSGLLTRRYHGLLIGALKPPLGRTLPVAKLEDTARYADQNYPLSTDKWTDGTIDPQGYRHIERFPLLRFGRSRAETPSFLSSFGLRSLAPEHPDYRGVYGGGPRERDSVYHQGTVWSWLLGPFVQAHLKVVGDPAEASSFLEPIADHIRTHGLGTASEIFDGDAPFTPRGCIAQAWTVGELIRCWTTVALAADAAASNIADKLTKKVVESLKEESATSTRKIRIQSYKDALD